MNFEIGAQPALCIGQETGEVARRDDSASNLNGLPRLLTGAEFSNSAAGLDIRVAADSCIGSQFSIADPQQRGLSLPELAFEAKPATLDSASRFAFRSSNERNGHPPHAVDDPKPKVRKAVRVWLADGTKMLGMWTGERWWSTKGEITPARWELEERKKKTKKLRKALRRSEGGEA